MSRAYKKILSLFGLASVIAITAIAYGIPPAQQADVSAAPSNEIKIEIEILGNTGSASIDKPHYLDIFYDGNSATAIISYDNATSLTVWLTLPDPYSSTIIEIPLTIGANPISLDLTPYLSIYGIYTIEVDGKDLDGDYMSGDAVKFSFHAITTKPANAPSTVRVNFGAVVCKLRVQVLGTDIDFIVDSLPGQPLDGSVAFIDVPIPNPTPGGDLNWEDHIVRVTAIDCSNDELEEADVTLSLPNPPRPPDTGGSSIFGLSLGRTDFLITGLSIFSVIVILALFLICRTKSKKAHR